MPHYVPAENRYQRLAARRCGRSGLHLPALSMGLWHNFGDSARLDHIRALARHCFDEGIFHFDLANNYGPPPGSAEEQFGRVLAQDLRPWRDELILSTKAGYHMWPGPHGEWGSRKYLLASLDQSLRRLGVEYVDVFYSHRPDPHTPLEETMGALDHAVRSGKALYAGVSNYSPEQTRAAAAILRRLGTPCVVHQPAYNLLNRWIENGLTDALREEGVGCIVFSPLAQGLLTDRYKDGIPPDSRAALGHFLKPERVASLRETTAGLRAVAERRGQTLAQMALQWCLRLPEVTSVLIGASSTAQIDENLAAVRHFAPFADDELAELDRLAPKK